MTPRMFPGEEAPEGRSQRERALAEAGRLLRSGKITAGRALLEQTNAASLAAIAETLWLIAEHLATANRRLAAIATALERGRRG